MSSQSLSSLDLASLLPESGMVWVGLSGGLDSTVLLHRALAAGLAQKGRLAVIHIHHGLQPDADGWARHCERLCRDQGVPCRIERVAVDLAQGIEAGARAARYRCFEALLGPDDTLLLGHHADDQAETLLLRLLRGAGVRGLAAMAVERPCGAGRLLRPLLAFSRAELEAYAGAHQLRWIDDSSNRDPRFDRNYLRGEVMPLLRGRWPALAELLGRAARLQGESAQLLAELAAEDLRRLCSDIVGSAGVSKGDTLQLSGFQQLSEPRQRNLLRHWLLEQGAEVPHERQLNALLEALAEAGEDRQPQLDWGDWTLLRYRDQLWLRPRTAESAAWEPQTWSPPQRLQLPAGVLSAEALIGSGVRLPEGSAITVCPRQGGERLSLTGRAGSRSLKKLLQEAGVPPWQRSQLPLIYVNGELAAVADRWVSEAFAANKDEPGWRIRWRWC